MSGSRRSSQRRAGVYRRRQLAVAGLVAAAIVALLAAGGVFGSSGTDGSRVLHYEIASPLAHRTLEQIAIEPPGKALGRRPLLVFLHGKGGGASSNVSQQLFAALARLGRTRARHRAARTVEKIPTGTIAPAPRGRAM